MVGDSGSGGPGRRSYEAQEVLRLLGVKAHVLRYWEQSLPLIRPRRNESGHRVWSAAQVRMLLRIRHLVLRRGMSVAAAGNAILYEAEPGPADTKARLESLRAGLITLLLRSRAELARASVTRSETEESPPESDLPPAGDALPGESDGSPPEGSRRLEGQPIILDGFVPSRREPPGRGLRFHRIVAPPLGVEEALPDAGEEEPSAMVPLSHLLGDGGDEAQRVAVLAALLEFHRETIGDAPLVIPAPAGELRRYEALLRSWKDLSRGDAFLLPVPPVVTGSHRWWSPRFALLVEIGSHQDLGTWLIERGCHTLYLWSPDDPALPPRPGPRWVRHARESRYGIALPAVTRSLSGKPTEMRLPDGAVLFLDTFRSALTEVLAVGRWSYTPATASPRGGRDLSGPGTWRYDLRQRDLLRLEIPVLATSSGWSPAPWRGGDWGQEVRWLRPELAGRMEA